MSSGEQNEKKISRETIEAYRSIDYSGFIERLFARGVDFLFVVGFGYLIYRKFGLFPAVTSALMFDLVTRILMTYFLGCTMGKFLFGVRVISKCSAKVSIWQVLIRELFKYISGIFLNLGYVSIVTSKRKRAWHDIAAGTLVTSGGKQEAQYGKEVYGENPQKWNLKVWAPITAVLIFVIIFGVNREASLFLNDTGMVGFTRIMSSGETQYRYVLASNNLGRVSEDKNVVQTGDINGDGEHEVFREDIKDGKTIIRDVVLIGKGPTDGDIEIAFDGPIIQYRFLDIDGDKKDELAVLLEDKSVKIYKFGENITDIAGYTVEYSEINAFIKGKPSEKQPARLYILGDKSKVTVLSASTADGKTVMASEKYSLPGESNLIGLGRGVLDGQNYLAALTDDNRLIFYTFDGKQYQKEAEAEVPVKGNVSFMIRDIDMDGKNEIVISSPENEDRPYPVLAAYSLDKGSLRLMWDGGRQYKIDDQKVQLEMDDGADTDKDKNFEAYMVSKDRSGQYGTFSLHIFQSDKYLMKANSILRRLSVSKPR